MKAYVDLGDMGEDARCRLIAQTIDQGHTPGFIVEDDAKADRYLEKIRAAAHVTVCERSRTPGPGGVGVLVVVGRHVS